MTRCKKMSAKNIYFFKYVTTATTLYVIDFQFSLFELFLLMWVFSASTKTHHFHIKGYVDQVDINSLFNEKSYEHSMSDWSDNNSNSVSWSSWSGSNRTLSVCGYVKNEYYFNRKEGRKREREEQRKRAREKEKNFAFIQDTKIHASC